jgi:polyisoprenoid-binding protein YceI
MTTRSRRAIPLALVAALAAFLLPAVASAQPVESGTVTMVSDPGDFIGGGLSYVFSTEDGDVVNAHSTLGRTVTVGVRGLNDQGFEEFFDLEFDAPGDQPLVPGTYANATRYPFNVATPGLSVTGNHRGCNQVTGTFTVTEAVYGGPDSTYLERFAATFEQHCEGGEPALRGEVSITNPPAPDVLKLGFEVAADGTFNRINGRATVHGTVTCTQPVTVNVNGTLTQVKQRTIITGPISVQVACTPGGPVDWQAVAIPTGTTPFQRGNAEAETSAFAQDPNFGNVVTVNRTQVVRLSRA